MDCSNASAYRSISAGGTYGASNSASNEGSPVLSSSVAQSLPSMSIPLLTANELSESAARRDDLALNRLADSPPAHVGDGLEERTDSDNNEEEHTQRQHLRQEHVERMVKGSTIPLIDCSSIRLIRVLAREEDNIIWRGTQNCKKDVAVKVRKYC